MDLVASHPLKQLTFPHHDLHNQDSRFNAECGDYYEVFYYAAVIRHLKCYLDNNGTTKEDSLKSSNNKSFFRRILSCIWMFILYCWMILVYSLCTVNLTRLKGFFWKHGRINKDKQTTARKSPGMMKRIVFEIKRATVYCLLKIFNFVERQLCICDRIKNIVHKCQFDSACKIIEILVRTCPFHFLATKHEGILNRMISMTAERLEVSGTFRSLEENVKSVIFVTQYAKKYLIGSKHPDTAVSSLVKLTVARLEDYLNPDTQNGLVEKVLNGYIYVINSEKLYGLIQSYNETMEKPVVKSLVERISYKVMDEPAFRLEAEKTSIEVIKFLLSSCSLLSERFGTLKPGFVPPSDKYQMAVPSRHPSSLDFEILVTRAVEHKRYKFLYGLVTTYSRTQKSHFSKSFIQRVYLQLMNDPVFHREEEEKAFEVIDFFFNNGLTLSKINIFDIKSFIRITTEYERYNFLFDLVSLSSRTQDAEIMKHLVESIFSALMNEPAFHTGNETRAIGVIENILKESVKPALLNNIDMIAFIKTTMEKKRYFFLYGLITVCAGTGDSSSVKSFLELLFSTLLNEHAFHSVEDRDARKFIDLVSENFNNRSSFDIKTFAGRKIRNQRYMVLYGLVEACPSIRETQPMYNFTDSILTKLMNDEEFHKENEDVATEMIDLLLRHGLNLTSHNNTDMIAFIKTTIEKKRFFFLYGLITVCAKTMDSLSVKSFLELLFSTLLNEPAFHSMEDRDAHTFINLVSENCYNRALFDFKTFAGRKIQNQRYMVLYGLVEACPSIRETQPMYNFTGSIFTKLMNDEEFHKENEDVATEMIDLLLRHGLNLISHNNIDMKTFIKTTMEKKRWYFLCYLIIVCARTGDSLSVKSFLESLFSTLLKEPAFQRVGETDAREFIDVLSEIYNNRSLLDIKTFAGRTIRNRRYTVLYGLVEVCPNIWDTKPMDSFTGSIFSKLINDEDFHKENEDVVSEMIDLFSRRGLNLACHNSRVMLDTAIKNGWYEVLVFLLRNGANPKKLSQYHGDTPNHAALHIGLYKKGASLKVLKTLIDLYKSNALDYQYLSPTVQDAKGDTLFHFVMKSINSEKTIEACKYLKRLHAPNKVSNNEDKLPEDYLDINDERHIYLTTFAFVKDLSVTKENIETMITELKESMDLKKYKFSTNNQHKFHKETKVQDQVDQIQDTSKKVMTAGAGEIEGQVSSEENLMSFCAEEWTKKNKPEENYSARSLETTLDHTVPITTEHGKETKFENDYETVQAEMLLKKNAAVFDNLPWEVECTENVWKILRNKKLSLKIREKAIHQIQCLASGEWSTHLCKPIKHKSKLKVILFETKLSKAARIIWELAVNFSPRLSDDLETTSKGECRKKVYSQIIRVWNVVFKHDMIKRAVDGILESHARGVICPLRINLRGTKQERNKRMNIKVPIIYREVDQEIDEDCLTISPLANSNKTEFNIQKFYTFSANLVFSILQNTSSSVDIPFKPTELEWDIIRLPSNAPILLLGRSGTGKTTCCIFRLWNLFYDYWTEQYDQLNRIDGLAKTKSYDGSTEKRMNPAARLKDDAMPNDDKGVSTEFESNKPKEAVNSSPTCESTSGVEDGKQCDHLRQSFVSKNPDLCKAVKRSFGQYIRTTTFAVNHITMENTDLPIRLDDVNAFQYPLSVTMRQLLLMLDASLRKLYFFKRSEDGRITEKVEGWTDDSETEMGQNKLEQNMKNKKPVEEYTKKEITYDFFKSSIWPKISKGFSHYKPSLVWTEIISFITGSAEAILRLSGDLNMEQYQTVGRKRAPHFAAHRNDIYVIYCRYKQLKKCSSLFDESDVIRDVHRRLSDIKEPRWIFHQIFVDETQDFSEAELFLLIRICSDPNKMFLTGDTAQGIINGISFRFCDLRSIFFNIGKTNDKSSKSSDCSVPKKIHQLTQNYRSHQRILSLASSVIDILQNFFPDTFDHLERDQGLFYGPWPILLQSTSILDLTTILTEAKEDAPDIEFGADQVVLVANNEAKKTLPEILKLPTLLVLTIYEAKGLEFNDVILFNFFKDSQAQNEWRIITTYLEELISLHRKSLHTKSLVEIDEEVLLKTNRPRSLKFDPKSQQVLCTELKRLYTAVTRARKKIWLFDEDVENRAPIFEYFIARKLARCMNMKEFEDQAYQSDEQNQYIFAEKSSGKSWVDRGNELFRHKLFETAACCYENGGQISMAAKAMAMHYSTTARREPSLTEMKKLYIYAAEKFLECGMRNEAAKCLCNAKEGRLEKMLLAILGSSSEIEP